MATENDTRGDAGASVDWEVAATLTCGDDALLGELIEMFPEESDKHLEAIRIGIEQGDGPTLARAAHTLKSSAGLFGASELAASALEMEILGQSSSFGEAAARLPGLQRMTSRVTAALKRGRPEVKPRKDTDNDEQ